MPPRFRSRRVLPIAMLIASAGLAAQAPLPDNPDKIALAWVDTTFRKLTLEDKLGQLVFVNASAGNLPSDTNEFDALQQKIKQLRPGGVHLATASAGSDALSSAVLINRLQALSALPLLATGDIAGTIGVGTIGATPFPHEMAVAATGNTDLAYEAGRFAGIEARALGLHVIFSPFTSADAGPRALDGAYLKGVRAGGAFGGVRTAARPAGDAKLTRASEDPIFVDAAGLDVAEVVRAISAGADAVVRANDETAVAAAIKAAVGRGDITAAQLDSSVRRLLRAKALIGLQKTRAVPTDEVPKQVGGRQHARVALDLSQRAITLLKDDRNQVPLRVPRDGTLLYLPISNGGDSGAPMQAEVRRRWPGVTMVEISGRSSPAELDLVRANVSHYDGVLVCVFSRAGSAPPQDLPAPVATFLTDLARATTNTPRPLVIALFGNPLTALAVRALPAIVLSYDADEPAQSAAARALAGEAPISGKLPVALPGFLEQGWGIVR